MSKYGVYCCWRKKKRDPASVQTGKEPFSSSHPPLSNGEEPSSSSSSPSPMLEQVSKSFADVNIDKADDFIKAIQQHLDLQETPSTSSSNIDKLSKWAPFIQSGATFLKFASDHTEKIDIKGNFSDLEQVTKIAGDILQHIGQLHWAVAGISIVGYLVSKSQKVSQNRTECADLLKDMLRLASRMKRLYTMLLEDESKKDLESAFQYIVEGSVCCACQLYIGYFFSFLKTSINSDTLNNIRSTIDRIYGELQVIIGKETLQTGQEMSLQLREMSARQPIVLPLSQPVKPKNAVGIEEQVEAVNKLLNINNDKDQSSTSVVIWGFGGIGKTTLAKAVVSTVDRDSYNYARIELDQDSDKNNYKVMQEQILKDAFPSYNGGMQVNLRDDSDGRDKLAEAFQSETNKPVFLFIDNALHKEDLEKILPEDLRGLPQRSRLLITTRILSVTDMLQERAIRRKDHLVKTLSPSHAAEVLCSDPVIRDGIKDGIEKMVKLCDRVPLVLKMVGAHLRKQKYNVERCTQIIGALQSGGNIKEENLGDRLFRFVYDQLEESTKEAFLDICCFFHKRFPRRTVEHIVGAEEVASLQEAALITTVMGYPQRLNTGDIFFDLLLSNKKTGEEELLSVHDIIQSIGCNSSKSSRIMDSTSWGKIDKDKGKFKGIKGVWVHGNDCVLERRHLNLIKDTLRILVRTGEIDIGVSSRDEDTVSFPELRFMNITGDISWVDVEALDKLAVLECEWLPSKQNDPLKLPESLRSIKITRQPAVMQDFMPNSSLEELYKTFELTDDGVSDNKAPAFYSRLGGLNKLKTLRVIRCGSLCELPEDMCGLQELNRLFIFNCGNLERLPESFGQLKALRHLDLSFCFKLKELPESFGQLKAQTRLEMSNCSSLKELPCTFGELDALQHITLFGCSRLKKLPSEFQQLRSLTYLDLYECSELESEICQMDESMKIVERSQHFCTDCWKDRKVRIRR